MAETLLKDHPLRIPSSGLFAGCDAFVSGIDNGYVCYKPGPVRYFNDGHEISLEEFERHWAVAR